MELNQLKDLLVLLREHGVTKYEHDGMTLELTPSGPIQRPSLRAQLLNGETDPEDDEPVGRSSGYDHPSLWRDGVRPEFNQ